MIALLACAPATLAPGDLAAVPDAAGPGLAPALADRDADWVVDCEGDEDFETIGDAVAAADDGDVLAVHACTYAETVDFAGKSLAIHGAGADVTTIEADRGSATVVVQSGETDGTLLSGFTLTGGSNDYGSAIFVDLSSLRVEDSVLTDNSGWATVFASSGDVELDGVTIEDNSARGGAEVYGSRGSLVITNSTISCDGSSYGMYASHGSAAVDWSTFHCDGAYATAWEHAIGRVMRTHHEGGLYSYQEEDHYDDAVYVENDVITGDVMAQYGAIVMRNSLVVGATSLSLISADYTVLEGNVFTSGRCAITTDVEGLAIRYNDFWDTTPLCQGPDLIGVDGNIDDDCAFVDFEGGDYTLSRGSPCEDAGPPEDERDDVDGSPNDIGVYGGIRSLGGGW
ncbi:MAG: hypothetical protein ACOZNI_16370 [Myxococcota bacterium]